VRPAQRRADRTLLDGRNVGPLAAHADTAVHRPIRGDHRRRDVRNNACRAEFGRVNIAPAERRWGLWLWTDLQGDGLLALRCERTLMGQRKCRKGVNGLCCWVIAPA
jgi:hypothetical protein